MDRLRTLVVHAVSPENATLSYQRAWPRPLAAHPELDCSFVNLAAGERVGPWLGRGAGREVDVVILLHSVFSNARILDAASARRIARSACTCVVFLANEYKLMPEKTEYVDDVRADLVVSQLDGSDALRLYRERFSGRVTWLPNAGLDPERFRPPDELSERSIEIGYRAYENPWYLGHRERRVLADAFSVAVRDQGLAADISLDPADRLGEDGWPVFLRRCVGQLGSEAGGDFFELDDRTRNAVNRHLDEHPDASFEEVHALFFEGYTDSVSGRALSSRIIEAAGTRTAQLLLEGRYGGLFQPDVHYIPVRKDLANVREAIAKLRDPGVRAEVTENAYRLVREELGSDRLVDRLVVELREIRS
jgi:hypothetical protein